MGAETKIEWCDHTFNPWIGCTRVSEGCAHCYAANSTRARVLRSQGHETWGKGARRALTSEANWKEPVRWNATQFRECSRCGWRGSNDCESCGLVWGAMVPTRCRVFCASLADWLDDEVSVAWLARLLQLIHDTPNLNLLLLTKRPQNWTNRLRGAMPSMGGHLKARSMVESWLLGFPPKNVWMGTTVENQARAEERVPALLKIPATVRFLSCEPLLGAVDLTPYLHRSDSTKMCPLCGFATNREAETNCPNDGALLGPDIAVDWVIAGGESGPGARPMHPAWARGLRDQCEAANVAFLFKQWGEFIPNPAYAPDWVPLKVGKKEAGRRLEGREWNGFPNIKAERP